MKDAREKLMSHILMVLAPLLVLLMITVAWFISSQTINLSEMSFAAQDSGPGAVLYPAEKLEGRDYKKDAATLTHSKVIWGEKLAPEDSDITIENMLPGQCEYYLLVSDKKFTPRLLNIRLTDAGGNELADDAIPTDLLPQCLGLYLIPLIDENDKVDLTVEKPSSANVTIALTRENDKLSAALFQKGAAAAVFPKITSPSDMYILAVFCDGVYGQNGPTSKDTHVGVLPGTISFSLAFDKTEEP